MATIVVVQSDDLAAWIGVAGVAVGVVLGAGIDSWRSRRAERKRRLSDLWRAEGELAAASDAYAETNRAAGEARNEVAWVEAINARLAAINAPWLTIRDAGDEDLNAAATSIMRLAMNRPPPGDEAAWARHLDETAEAHSAFGNAVRKARL